MVVSGRRLQPVTLSYRRFVLRVFTVCTFYEVLQYL